jgi:hypothetical protein
MTNPRTGHAANNITSPDVNSAITGTRGNTLGTPGDITSTNPPTAAGSGSPGAQSTAAVSTREEMEKASLRARLAEGHANAQNSNAEKKAAAATSTRKTKQRSQRAAPQQR